MSDMSIWDVERCSSNMVAPVAPVAPVAAGLSKLSEREDHSSQKHVEFPGLEEQLLIGEFFGRV